MTPTTSSSWVGTHCSVPRWWPGCADAFGVDLHPSAIFQTPTVAGLADDHPAPPGHLDGRPGRRRDDDAADALPPDLLAEIRAMTPEQLREQLARELDPLAE